jgi:hypothetical protein
MAFLTTLNGAVAVRSLILVIFYILAPVAHAQEPIRVQTNQVLVPVFVLDKQRARDFYASPENLFRAIGGGDTQIVDTIVEGLVIRNLAAVDFRVFDDGKEQVVQNVAYGPSLYWDVRDNNGHHTEYFGPGGGKWSTAEWPPGRISEYFYPHYLIAYALPESPAGSCHQIRVKVNRSNAVVAARSEYCNSQHSASDPLNGTKLGGQLESDLAGLKNGNVDISLIAVAFYTESDAARVHIALDWPWKSLKGKSRTKGVLAEVYNKDGSLAMRFSDAADKEGLSDREIAPLGAPLGLGPDTSPSEHRYDAQVNLPPGEYNIRVALGDGTRFGRAEIPLTIDNYDKNALAISAVSLCKQISDVSSNARKLPGAWRAKLPGNYVPLVSNDTEFKPTSNTRFRAGEIMYVYFEIYEPLIEGDRKATVDFEIHIVDLKTGELKSDPQPISATPYLRAGSSIIPIGRGIDISKVPKGSYRLDVRATDSTGKSTERRSVNFTVE